MPGFVSTMEDAWSDGKGKGHYSSLSASVIVRTKEKVEVDAGTSITEDSRKGNLLASVASGESLVSRDAKLVIALRSADSTGKAADVAAGYKADLATVNLQPTNVALSTWGGCAVGVAARRELEQEIEGWKICVPHDTSRAILHALGVGTKESKNLIVKKLLKKNRRVGSFFRRSANWTTELLKAQNNAGIIDGSELCAAVGDVSRWSADFDTVRRSSVLE